MNQKSETQELLTQMHESGWRTYRGRKGHWICKAPDGITTIVLASTGSDHRGMKNSRARFNKWQNSQKVEEKVAQYVCGECYKNFDRPQGLTNHKRIVHSTETFPCNECDRVFTNAGSLGSHKNSHREKVIPVKVPVEKVEVKMAETVQSNGHQVSPQSDELEKIVEDLLLVVGRLDTYVRTAKRQSVLKSRLQELLAEM